MKNVNEKVVKNLKEALNVLEKLKREEIESFDFAELNIECEYMRFRFDSPTDFNCVETSDDFIIIDFGYNCYNDWDSVFSSDDNKFIDELIEKISDKLDKIEERELNFEKEEVCISLEQAAKFIYPETYYLVDENSLEDLLADHFEELEEILENYNFDLSDLFEKFEVEEGEDKIECFAYNLRKALRYKYDELRDYNNYEDISYLCEIGMIADLGVNLNYDFDYEFFFEEDSQYNFGFYKIDDEYIYGPNFDSEDDDERDVEFFSNILEVNRDHLEDYHVVILRKLIY